MKKLTTIILLTSCLHVFTQSDSIASKNLRLVYKNHFGICLGGPAFLGAYYEHFFDNNWSVELGVGSVIAVSSIYIEGRYYFGKKDKIKKVSPYFGLAIGRGSIIDNYATTINYAPFGIQYLSMKGNAISFEAACLYFDGSFFPSGAIKIRLF